MVSLLSLLSLLLLSCSTQASTLRGTTTNATTTTTPRYLSTPSYNDNDEDILAAFKNRNLLRDDFEKNPIQFSLNSPQVTLGGSVISLAPPTLKELPGVYGANAEVWLDGVKQPAVPASVLYTPAGQDDTWVWMNGNTLERAMRRNPTTGKTSVLLPMDLDLQVFTEVETTDVDTNKLSRYHFSEDSEPTRSLQELYDSEVQSRQSLSTQFDAPNPPPPCTSYKIIKVAIAYESRFCQAMGGVTRANQVVQLTIAQASEKFQRSSLCTKLELSHLEGYCDPKTDPYHNMFAGSVCKRDDDTSILKLFRNYWTANRRQVQRDVAHLFHGFNHASGTVGCAWQGSLCDHDWGYGVNELTFGGNNNPTFWGILFAHELGHSAGAPHEALGDTTLMDPLMCLDCDEFSDTSVAHINLHMVTAQCLKDEGAVETAPDSGPIVDTGIGSDNSNAGTCSQRLQYCNLGPCCAPHTCYNRFICL